MALTLHPVPGKAKAKMLCEAFAAGAPRDATGHIFYGVTDGNLAAWQRVQAKGLDYFFLDNSYFDKVRGAQFRVTKNRTQRHWSGTSDCKRFAALNIPVLPPRTGEYILAVEQSPLFMRVIANDPCWLDRAVREMAPSGLPVRMRPWNGNKPTLALSFAEELKRAAWVVSHSSAALVEAALAGVSTYASHMSAAECVPPDRRQWAGMLADSQFTIDEMKDGTAWSMLHEERAR